PPATSAQLSPACQTKWLPPHQMQLSSHLVSPQHTPPFEQQVMLTYSDKVDYGRVRGTACQATQNYSHALKMIADASMAVFYFAEATAWQQRGLRIPLRLPTENEVIPFLNKAILQVQKLEEVRNMVQEDEGARDAGGHKGLRPPYHTGQRAPAPRRCHGCNRCETPRTGPLGPRTLCNACGRNYAKSKHRQTLKRKPEPANN
ncbi:hypothetical protein QBC46DRAFT_272711, partial [Diplogelasinospora grovesii]